MTGDTGSAAAEDILWPTWRRLIRALPVSRMPWEWITSPSMWRLFGADFLTGLLRNRTTRSVFAVLEPLSPGDLRRIHALALVNHRRHEAVSRWFAIGFVTLPASAALTLSELAPDTLRAIAAAEGPARWYFWMAYAAVAVALYLMFAWRARQLLTLVELMLIQRGVDLRDDAAADESPIETPIGG
ncbi:MAG: hypothetical protein JNK30_03905 [Phenylobacterium sp.]|uniref:hypothetical protein n=1 Tax=Phenylobacterium sp. TaxID=1871053 RepID=UPI001A6464A9|nr:hypothetical protein [Phenylobacterium sp.]MBL8770503.1 hypothetical protein [Phenylobacterium sp.]